MTLRVRLESLNLSLFSDVIGATLLGVGTTELFLYLHQRHQENLNSFKVFALSAPPTSAHARQTVVPTGIGVAFNRERMSNVRLACERSINMYLLERSADHQ
jgi:hypothetical protein